MILHDYLKEKPFRWIVQIIDLNEYPVRFGYAGELLRMKDDKTLSFMECEVVSVRFDIDKRCFVVRVNKSVDSYLFI